MIIEDAVKDRYGAASQEREVALCCPVDYNPEYLKIIPSEVIERDYGCGDPSKYVKEGETVLDLGSGTGKICFIASQVVGPKGKVIGVDMTDDMLEVAEKNAPIIAERVGYANVEFRKGRIQDLALDLRQFEQELANKPITSAEGWMEAEAVAKKLSTETPMIPDNSVDVVVSNCVLNLVETDLKEQMFEEIFRVLKKGGRAVISDIVSDEEIPQHMVDDKRLWSGCISGAMTETGFIKAFEDAGFYGITQLKFETEPWQVVEGIEFRSVTIEAYKGKEGPCLDAKQAVIYKGPFKEVIDDDNHVIVRGERTAVCEKTFKIYSQAPYKDLFDFVEPLEAVAPDEMRPFVCSTGTVLKSGQVQVSGAVRKPRDTKGQNYNITTDPSQCDPSSGCC